MGILYSPSKVLMASETVLAFVWAKTCSTMDFSHSSSSTVPRYRAWNDWMFKKAWAAVRASASADLGSSACSVLQRSLHLEVLTLAASAHLLVKRPHWNEAQKNRSAYFQAPATKSKPWMAKVQQENSAKPWTDEPPFHWYLCPYASANAGAKGKWNAGKRWNQ